MMKRLYLVIDRVSEMAVGGVMEFPADAAAIRTFTDLVNGSDNMVAKHPADYTLVYIGQYDVTSGTVEVSHGGPEELLNGATVVALREAVNA